MDVLFDTAIIFGMVAFCGCVSSLAGSSSVVTKTTLTTAKFRGDASPKPSIAYRRINVEPVEAFSSTPYNLFQVTVPYRRSNVDDIFRWDYWCQSQPKTGKCSAKEKQGPMTQNYYYDAQLDTCKTFHFSGCDGNKNNFRSLVECERHCKVLLPMITKDGFVMRKIPINVHCVQHELLMDKLLRYCHNHRQIGSIYMSIKDTTRSTYCNLQPNAGNCMALLQRYYYDISAKECQSFLYGGCGGNQNRFDTYELCIKRCKGE